MNSVGYEDLNKKETMLFLPKFNKNTFSFNILSKIKLWKEYNFFD